jgi:hypothetical protein
MQDHDVGLIQRIGGQLCDIGNHSPMVRIGAVVGGSWRAKSTKALLDADAFIALLTKEGVETPNVLGEIGAARIMEYSLRNADSADRVWH